MLFASTTIAVLHLVGQLLKATYETLPIEKQTPEMTILVENLYTQSQAMTVNDLITTPIASQTSQNAPQTTNIGGGDTLTTPVNMSALKVTKNDVPNIASFRLGLTGTSGESIIKPSIRIITKLNGEVVDQKDTSNNYPFAYVYDNTSGLYSYSYNYGLNDKGVYTFTFTGNGFTYATSTEVQ